MKITTFAKYMAAATFAASMLVIPSCKDDDDKSSNELPSISAVALGDNELLSKGVTVGMEGQMLPLDIKSSGSWSAAIDPSCDWCDIDDVKTYYTGDQQITLSFEDNLTGADRSTTLYISGDNDLEIKITQGASDSNGDGYKFASMGVGSGVDYDYAFNVKTKGESSEDFKPTLIRKNNCIFNLSKIEQLIKANKIDETAFVAANLEFTDLKSLMFDSTLSQKKDIALTLDLSVSFGVIELTAGLEYSAHKKEERTYVDYVITREAPMYNVVVSEADIAAFAEDAMLEHNAEMAEIKEEIENRKQQYYLKNGKEELTKAQQKIIDKLYTKLERSDFGGVFNTSFVQLYWKLFDAVNNENFDEADNILNSIDNRWGPFYISGGDFGGSITIHCKVKNMEQVGTAEAAAKLEAAVGGMFNIKGDFAYSEDGTNFLRDSDIRIQMFGGNANETADDLYATFTSDKVTDYSVVQETLKNWVNSMKTMADGNPEPTKVSPIRFNITPIWSLFNDDDVQKYAQDYFLQKYADRGIYSYFKIMKGEKRADGSERGASDVLNEENWNNDAKTANN